MSDFQNFLQEQLQDPEFRRWWETKNELLVRQSNGKLSLSEMMLDEEEKSRILFAMQHPEEFELILDQIIHEHIVDLKAFDEAMAEYKANPKTYSHDEIKKILEE